MGNFRKVTFPVFVLNNLKFIWSMNNHKKISKNYAKISVPGLLSFKNYNLKDVYFHTSNIGKSIFFI